MVPVATPSLVRQIESLFAGGSVAGLSDRQLIERFVAGRDSLAAEAAFTALVTRHGPMVLGACRQVLGDYQRAEDAFQAVFLVLARRARSIRDPDRLSNWLYGVALRTARNARRRLARNRRREEELAMQRPEAGFARPADQPAIDREQAEALHEEIGRLPATIRLPVILCYFEGLSLAEAARRLQCPAGTIHSRLDRARETLRRGLRRRGFVLSTTAIATMLPPRSASASIPSLLCDSTTRAAIAFAARHAAGGALSASAAAMAQEVLRTMMMHKLKAAALSLVLLVTLATGAGSYALNAMAQSREGEPPGEPTAQKARTEPRPPEPTRPATGPGQMTVAGRVLDPRGQPVTGAAVMIYARSLVPPSLPAPPNAGPLPIGAARSDASGRFRIEAPRISSSGHANFGAIALAPGYGAGWVTLDLDADQPAGDIALRPEQEIRGRLFDVQSRPVAGIRVSVSSIGRPGPLAPARGRAQAQFDGASFRPANIIDNPAWPASSTTDAEGRFVLRGIGRGVRVGLEARHPQFAPQTVTVDTDETPGPKAMTAALAPSQIIHMRLTYADTGRPVSHAPLLVSSSHGRAIMFEEAETDGEGRARLNPRVADRIYNIIAYPPEGQPYLIGRKSLEWPKGSLEQSLDLALPRGVLIRGRIVEAGTGRPVAGALTTFVPRGDRGNTVNGPVTARSAADGSFRVGGKPGPGILLVKAPGDDYVLEEIGLRMINEGQPGGGRSYINAHAALDLKPGVDTEEVRITLRRGVTVTGLVVGPDGRPAPGTRIFGRAVPDPTREVRGARSSRAHVIARGGRFELPGIDPDAETPVYFLDSEHKLGATVNLSGKSIAMLTLAGRDGRVEPGATIAVSGGSMARGPITVRLEPCGSARARFVDRDGHPVAAQLFRDIALVMIITPGALSSRDPAQSGAFLADMANPARIDPRHYKEEQTADAEGRLTLPVLIPGASYRIVDYTGERTMAPRLRKEFTVKPGENLDLGDILIEKPGE